jgi:hypothetical protein
VGRRARRRGAGAVRSAANLAEGLAGPLTVCLETVQAQPIPLEPSRGPPGTCVQRMVPGCAVTLRQAAVHHPPAQSSAQWSSG